MVYVVSGPPTLPQLLRLKIPQRVGANYSTFGILLLNDTVGSRVRALKKECQGDADDIILRILQEWLEGRGFGPVTWETLIKTLRDSDLSALADEVHQKLPPTARKVAFPDVGLVPKTYWGHQVTLDESTT